MKNNRAAGAAAERMAAKKLIEAGFQINEMNFRFRRLGEIDIIASMGTEIHFVEVKARSTDAYGTPAEAVNNIKRNTIRKVADIYLARAKERSQATDRTVLRFDIAEVDLRTGEINFIFDAF